VSAPVLRGILVTHGALGAELVKTAESILGPQERLAVLSNAGKSHDTLLADIQAEVPAGERVVVFVDLLGGSCGHSCALVQRRHPEVLLASGVNLPMLLEFLYHRGRVEPGELKGRLEHRAREGVRCLGWEDLA